MTHEKNALFQRWQRSINYDTEYDWGIGKSRGPLPGSLSGSMTSESADRCADVWKHKNCLTI